MLIELLIIRKVGDYMVKILKISDYLKENQQEFIKLISKVYLFSNELQKDYPLRLQWYWQKVVPDIFCSVREIFIATKYNEIIGIAILKKENKEKKICTLLVDENYRRQGIANQLLRESFLYLGTSKPLISIPEYKVNQFSKIIKKYGWKETQVLEKGYYSNLSKEIVFNGKIV